MNDLFQSIPKPKDKEYSAKDIEVLEGLQPVRDDNPRRTHPRPYLTAPDSCPRCISVSGSP